MLSKLKTLQQQFKNYICDGDLAIADHLVGNKVEKKTRLSIYQSAYRASCLATLKLDFPVLLKVIGESVFAELAHQYAKQYPPAHPVIHHFSQQFPVFLQGIDRYYADLANIEWAVDEVLDTEEGVLLTIGELQQIAQTQLADYVFQLAPAVNLLSISSNAEAVWQAFQSSQQLPMLGDAPTKNLLVFHRQYQADYLLLDDKQVMVVNALRAKKTFAELCELLCELMPADDVPAYSISMVAQWAEWGLLRACA